MRPFFFEFEPSGMSLRELMRAAITLFSLPRCMSAGGERKSVNEGSLAGADNHENSYFVNPLHGFISSKISFPNLSHFLDGFFLKSDVLTNCDLAS